MSGREVADGDRGARLRSPSDGELDAMLDNVVVPPGLFWLVTSIMLTMVAFASLITAVVRLLVTPEDVPVQAIATLAGVFGGGIAITVPNAMLLLGVRAGHLAATTLVRAICGLSMVAVIVTAVKHSPIWTTLAALALSVAAQSILASARVRLCAAFCLRRRERRIRAAAEAAKGRGGRGPVGPSSGWSQRE